MVALVAELLFMVVSAPAVLWRIMFGKKTPPPNKRPARPKGRHKR